MTALTISKPFFGLGKAERSLHQSLDVTRKHRGLIRRLDLLSLHVELGELRQRLLEAIAHH